DTANMVNASTGVGIGPSRPGLNPPMAATATMAPTQAAAITTAATFDLIGTAMRPTSIVTSAATIAPNVMPAMTSSMNLLLQHSGLAIRRVKKAGQDLRQAPRPGILPFRTCVL